MKSIKESIDIVKALRTPKSVKMPDSSNLVIPWQEGKWKNFSGNVSIHTKFFTMGVMAERFGDTDRSSKGVFKKLKSILEKSRWDFVIGNKKPLYNTIEGVFNSEELFKLELEGAHIILYSIKGIDDKELAEQFLKVNRFRRAKVKVSKNA